MLAQRTRSVGRYAKEGRAAAPEGRATTPEGQGSPATRSIGIIGLVSRINKSLSSGFDTAAISPPKVWRQVFGEVRDLLEPCDCNRPASEGRAAAQREGSHNFRISFVNHHGMC